MHRYWRRVCCIKRNISRRRIKTKTYCGCGVRTCFVSRCTHTNIPVGLKVVNTHLHNTGLKRHCDWSRRDFEVKTQVHTMSQHILGETNRHFWNHDIRPPRGMENQNNAQFYLQLTETSKSVNRIITIQQAVLGFCSQ